jgi:hypothetical protein
MAAGQRVVLRVELLVPDEAAATGDERASAAWTMIAGMFLAIAEWQAT